jgi:hypothetical protein
MAMSKWDTFGLFLAAQLAAMPATLPAAFAREGAVTFADLQGTVIHVHQRFRQEGTHNGVPFTNPSTFDATIAIDSMTSVTVSRIFRAVTASGPRESRRATESYTLGNPKSVTSQGGGHAVVMFERGKLIALRTYKTGGLKWTVSFSRSGGKLRCAVEGKFAHEAGAAGFRWVSPVVGGDIRMKRMEQTASSCRIDKR